ncbi:GtrA family protein [Paenactinomyces guangxiensis]|uniref:GtrA family protein n=1 Tax=Paenactinomyces guangxiensis TaxID=1490290 RepID=A0A7W2A703_9BACL|nr:GtrA family protein [Paenactinomyces guangxiensis]MBA4493055.1 GtrA family protein [Paenactinomyces guangxiensis]MBH8590096.1 GtrA family protein [Paenactinomyces guangxiensis]
MKIINNQIIRFVIVGALNTAIYYLLYLIFIHLIKLDYLISHILAFILSMIGSFFMNTHFTYKTKPTLKKFLQFPLTYVVNISVTTGSVYILVDLLGWDKNISPLVASLIAIPFTFIVSKKILVRKANDTYTGPDVKQRMHREDTSFND